MDKLKKVIIIGILMLILCSSTGCDWGWQGESDMTMSKDGKGTFSITVKIYKDFFSEKHFSKVNGIDEYVAKLKAQTDKDIDLKYTIDKDKSKEVDYITVSFEYNSIEEFEEKIRMMDEKSLNLYNTSDTSYLSSDVFDSYNNYKRTLDTEFQKYLKDNGITFNPKGKNYKKIFENVYICTNHYQKEHTGKHKIKNNKSVLESYVKLEKKGSESTLTIKPNAIFAFSNYISEMNYFIGNDVLDFEKLNPVLSEFVYDKEIKYIYDFLNMVKISKELKLVMDKDKKVEGYDIDKYNEKIFDDENFSGEYAQKLDDYINAYDEDENDEKMQLYNADPRNKLETLYSTLLFGLDCSILTMVNISYGDNTYETEEYLLSYMDSITISSVKGKKAIETWKKEVIDEYSHDKSDTDKEIDKNDNKNKNDNKDKDVNSELLDKSPDTGDDTDVSLILGLVGLAGLSGIGLIRLIRYVRN